MAHVPGAPHLQVLEAGSYTWYLGKALTDTGPAKTLGHLPDIGGGWMCVDWNPEKHSV